MSGERFVYCEACGRRLREDARFCDWCGRGVAGKELWPTDYVKADPQENRFKPWQVVAILVGILLAIVCLPVVLYCVSEISRLMNS